MTAADSVIEKRTRSLGTNAALAATGGCLDAFTYVGHGHIFANSMTGNVVLLAINALSRDWLQSFRHVPPIITFLIGVASARALALYSQRKSGSGRRPSVLLRGRALLVLAVEIVLLFGLSWLPGNTYNFVFTTVICFAASLQTATFRQIGSFSYNSTFTTGNLRSLSESFFDWTFCGRRPEALQQTVDFAVICFTFFMGALLGALLTPKIGNETLWLITAILLGCFVWIAVPEALSLEPLG